MLAEDSRPSHLNDSMLRRFLRGRGFRIPLLSLALAGKKDPRVRNLLFRNNNDISNNLARDTVYGPEGIHRNNGDPQKAPVLFLYHRGALSLRTRGLRWTMFGLFGYMPRFKK